MEQRTKIPRFNCYFGCREGGPLHHFPMPYSDVERFNVWKAVLEDHIQEKGNMYIYNRLRLCNKHFESYYISSSNRLTRNSVPTLYLKEIMCISLPTSTELCIEYVPETKTSVKEEFVEEGRGLVTTAKANATSSQFKSILLDETVISKCSKNMTFLNNAISKTKP